MKTKTRVPLGTSYESMFFDLHTGHCYVLRYGPQNRRDALMWVRDHQRAGLIDDCEAEQACLEIADNTWEPVNEPANPESCWPWIIGAAACVLTWIIGRNQ